MLLYGKKTIHFIILTLALIFIFDAHSQCSFSLISSPIPPSCENQFPGNILVFPTNNAVAPFVFNIYDATNTLYETNNSGSFSDLPPGTYLAEVVDAFNCTATVNIIVPFINPPQISINNLQQQYCIYEGNINLIAQPFGTTLTINGLPSNQFNTGNLGLGTHIVEYFYNDNATGCNLQGAFTFDIIQNDFANALFPLNYCATDNSTIPLSTSQGDGTFVLNGNQITTINPFQLGVGAHVIDYFYFDGICNNNIQYLVNVNQPNMYINSFAVGFNVTVTGPSDATAYNWSLPNSQTAITESTSFIVPNYGSYTICLDAEFGNCNVFQCEVINVTANNVTSGFIYQQNGTTFDFTNQSVNATNYFWDFGDGTTSTQTNPTHQYAQNGNYQVCLNAINGIDNIQFCNFVSINCTFPTADFTFATNGLQVNFGNFSTNATDYLWDFGDGDFVSFEQPNHNFASQNIYTVCLTSSNNCGSDTICKDVQLVCPTPQIEITYSENNLEYNFNANVTNGTSYFWIFGDGNTSDQQNITYTYAASDNYVVCLSSSNACGTNNQCININAICNLPEADFTVQSDGADAFFTFNNNNYDNIVWNFGDGTVSGADNPNHTFGSLGTYTVCVSVSNLCGNDQICQNVNISCAPFVDFELTQTSDLGFTVTNNSTNIDAYQWLVDNVNYSTTANPQITLQGAGNFEVCLIGSNICGNNQYCQIVEVNCLPIDAAFTLNQNTDSYLVDFDVLNENVDYLYNWFIDGYEIANEADTTFNFFTQGLFEVCLQTINFCDTLLICENLDVECPQANAIFSEIQNSSYVYTFEANDANATDFVWTVDNNQVSTSQNFNYNFVNDGNYTVCLLLSNGCDIQSYCNTINVVCNNPDVAFSVAQTNAEATYDFETPTFLTQYSWTVDGIFVSNDQNFSHIFTLDIGETDTVEICLSGFNECNLFGVLCQEVVISSIISFNIINQQNVSCFGENDAFIELQIMEGTNAATILYDSLDANTNFVTVTLSNGTLFEIPVTIEEPTNLAAIAQIENTICLENSNEGSLNINATGGTQPFTYFLNGYSSFESNFNNLAYGNYNVMVQDANGCQFELDTVFIDANNNIEMVVENITGANNGSEGAIDISVIGNANPFTFNWSNGIETEDIANLQAGDYQIEVTDVNGCSASLTITVSNVVSIENNLQNTLNVYPNPFNNQLVISSENLLQSIEIYNANGKLIKLLNQINQSNKTLATNNLQKGIYFIKIFTNQNTITKRLIKE